MKCLIPIVIISLMILVACNGDNEPEDLAGTKWVLVSYPGFDDIHSVVYTDTDSNIPITVEFNPIGSLVGNAGCGKTSDYNYSGRYEIVSDNLSIQPIVTFDPKAWSPNFDESGISVMNCMTSNSEKMKTHYLQVLGASDSYEISDNLLTINCGKKGVLVFKRNILDNSDNTTTYAE